MKEFIIKSWCVSWFCSHRFILVAKINYMEIIDIHQGKEITTKFKKVYVCEKCGKLKVIKSGSEFIDKE